MIPPHFKQQKISSNMSCGPLPSHSQMNPLSQMTHIKQSHRSGFSNHDGMLQPREASYQKHQQKLSQKISKTSMNPLDQFSATHHKQQPQPMPRSRSHEPEAPSLAELEDQFAETLN